MIAHKFLINVQHGQQNIKQISCKREGSMAIWCLDSHHEKYHLVPQDSGPSYLPGGQIGQNLPCLIMRLQFHRNYDRPRENINRCLLRHGPGQLDRVPVSEGTHKITAKFRHPRLINTYYTLTLANQQEFISLKSGLPKTKVGQFASLAFSP